MPAVQGASSDPLWQGTVAFVILAVALGLLGQILALRGKVVTRHESGLWCFLTSVLCFLMWMMVRGRGSARTRAKPWLGGLTPLGIVDYNGAFFFTVDRTRRWADVCTCSG